MSNPNKSSNRDANKLSRGFFPAFTLLGVLSLAVFGLVSINSFANTSGITTLSDDVNMSNGMVSSVTSMTSAGMNPTGNNNSSMMSSSSMGNTVSSADSMMYNNSSMDNSSSSASGMSGNTVATSTTKDTFELTRIDGNQLTLLKDNKTQEVDASGDLKITKNGVTAKVSDLKPKDQVTVTKDSNGNVISIEAVAREVFDTSYYVVPIIVSLILLGLVGYLIYRQMNKGHIKTRATKIQ